jgi:hypothetical protein
MTSDPVTGLRRRQSPGLPRRAAWGALVDTAVRGSTMRSEEQPWERN